MDSEVLELLSDYTTEVVTAIVLGVVFFLLMRRYFAARRAKQWTEAPPVPITFTPAESEEPASLRPTTFGEPHEMAQWEPVGAQETQTLEESARLAVTREERIPPSLLATASALPEQPERPASNVANFGAYRIEQEVSKLADGQPHRVEVLSSRAPQDRQAIEASLMRILYDPKTDETMRNRVRQAMADYGFIAHRCAELLMAQELRERATAAKVLGAVGDKTVLPFLLEALYDSDEAVRLLAVESLGELKLPGAIGALLDLARRHPEMPPALLSNALNACSVDSLSFLDVPMVSAGPLLLDDFDDEEAPEEDFADFVLAPATLAEEEFTVPEPEVFEPAPEELATTGPLVIEPTVIEMPLASQAQPLPAGDDDEKTLAILSNLEKADTKRQAELYRELGQYRTRLSLETLAMAATHNPDPMLRAAAVSGLCDLDHPAGFPSILLAVGDESREVRAAAARSFSRLSFDRSEAYRELVENEPPEKMAVIAQACIKAGMATQALDRLASADSRQSYESFAMLSLLTKAGELGPLLDAVAHHRNKSVRLNTLRLLIETPNADVPNQLRQLAISEGISDEMRNALLEAIYKIEESNRRVLKKASGHDNRVARVA